MYDAGLWYVASRPPDPRQDVATNIGLATITPRKITTTGGVRLLRSQADPGAPMVLVRRQQRLPAG